ncbi:hypothetical protein J0X12_03255 [Sneathiella sp. CAU 1612]|uniref:Uncharacterized protein n=1 Tax=Sneathiella sedimenti TaxID=2816034 RepID=A0ABS3F276_9PROT|nr:hypothetical protein [Sneathiella sedimenti]MBO0332615.1 hypothetical protein [Sneathiella sedimenti]
MRPVLGGYVADTGVFQLSDAEVKEIKEYVKRPEGVVERVEKCGAWFLGSAAIERQRPKEKGTRKSPGVKDHLKSIKKSAGKLASLIEEINNPNDPVGFSAFDSLAEADPETAAINARKLEKFAEHQLTRLSKPGRQSIGEHQQFLIRQLREIYLAAGGDKHKVTHNSYEDTNKEDGPFFQFVWVVFNSIKKEHIPDMKVTNSSVGGLIRRALKDGT